MILAGYKSSLGSDPMPQVVRKYRQFVYETGAVNAGKGKTMDKKIVEKARRKGYKISRADRFRYRCIYFTDSGVIGGKDFVQEAPVK